jgi:putative peptidoglycan binding protein
MNTTTEPTTTRSFLAVLLVGIAAGVLAGIAMLVTMGILRLAFGWPTPTELIFDRLFPFLTVEFFISSLVKAGGYTPLKLQGVYGALAGQVAVAAIGGIIYSWYLNRLERRQHSSNANQGIVDMRGWRLIVPSVLVATVLFVILLWPTLITNYHGLPPARARIVASLEMLISFSVCGFGIMLFHALLLARPARKSTERAGVHTTGRRRFLASSAMRQSRTSGRAEFNRRIAAHIAERHDGNWHRDWDRRRAHFDHDRFFVFIDGFWCGLDAGFFPWDYYPYYAYDYYPYDYDPGYYADAQRYDQVYSNRPMRDQTVTAVQGELAQLGYYNGPIDGIYGRLTRDAVAKYQIARKLDVSGNLSAQTLQSLGLPQTTPS